MKIGKVLRIVREEGVARRFLVMNSFDGILTVVGVLVAMYLLGECSPRVVVISCMAPAVALMISGIWSAYTIESAERGRELEVIEKQMLTDLGDTRVGRRFNVLVVFDSLVNGLSPLIVSIIIISPFILSFLDISTIKTSFHLSFMLAATILFLLGAFVGRLGGKSVFAMGFSMVVMGVFIAVIMYLINTYLLPL